ncbi:MAG: IS3 family transposase, partial [Acidobacteriota bacterium]
MERFQAAHPVGRLCQALEVSRSGHYARRHRGESRRRREDRVLKQEILSVHGKARGCYGTPRIEQALRRQGIQTSRKRVSRLRRELGLRAKGRRRFHATTDSKHSYAVAPNRLNRRFVAARPDEIWVGDVTYLRRGPDWLYLAFLLDVHSRRIVGWSVRNRLDEHLTLEALRRAVESRRPSAGLIHHT